MLWVDRFFFDGFDMLYVIMCSIFSVWEGVRFNIINIEFKLFVNNDYRIFINELFNL